MQQVVLHRDFPRNAAGKTLKRELREHHLSGAMWTAGDRGAAFNNNSGTTENQFFMSSPSVTLKVVRVYLLRQ